MNFIKKHKYFFILIFALFIGIQVVSADNLFQNNLLKIDLSKTSSGIKVTLYTSKPFKEPIKAFQKGDPKYVMLLPETSASLSAKPSLNDVSDIVKGVNLKTQPYVNNLKGFTKITISTTKNVQITTQVKTQSAPIKPKAKSSKKVITQPQNVVRKQATSKVPKKQVIPQSYKKIQKPIAITQKSKVKVVTPKIYKPTVSKPTKVSVATKTAQKQVKSIQKIEKKQVTVKPASKKVEQHLVAQNKVATKVPTPTKVTKVVPKPSPSVKTPRAVPTKPAVPQQQPQQVKTVVKAPVQPVNTTTGGFNILTMLQDNMPFVILGTALFVLLILLVTLLKKPKQKVQQQQNPVIPNQTQENEENIEFPTYTQETEQPDAKSDIQPEIQTTTSPFEEEIFNEEIFSDDFPSKSSQEVTPEEFLPEKEIFEEEAPFKTIEQPEKEPDYSILDELSDENFPEEEFNIETIEEMPEESSTLDELNEILEQDNINEEENVSLDELLGEDENLEEYDYYREPEQEVSGPEIEPQVEPEIEDYSFEQPVVEETPLVEEIEAAPEVMSEPEIEERIEEVPEPIVEPVAEPQTEQVEEEKTETDEQENEMIKSEFAIDDEKGFYLVDFEDTSALVGHIDEKIFILKKFDKKIQEPLQVRLDEQKTKSTSYIARIGKYRALVDVTDNNMNLLIEL